MVEFCADGFEVDPDAKVESWDDVVDGSGASLRIGNVEDHVDGWKWVYRVGEFIYFVR